MANIAPAKQYLNDTEIQSDAPLSEALESKMGASVNYALDFETRINALEHGQGAVAKGAGSHAATGSAYSATILSKAFTLGANDYVRFKGGKSGSDFSRAGFQITTSASDSVTLAVKRSGTTLLSKSYSGGGTGGVLGPTDFVDKPGVGTFAYTLEFSSAFGYAMNWDGEFVFEIVRG